MVRGLTRARRGPEPARGAQRRPDDKERRDSGEVPAKEPQSRLSRRNRERRGPEQVQSGPDCILPSPLRVKEKRQRMETPRRKRKLRRGPGVGWDLFSNTCPLIFLSKPLREPTNQ